MLSAGACFGALQMQMGSGVEGCGGAFAVKVFEN